MGRFFRSLLAIYCSLLFSALPLTAQASDTPLQNFHTEVRAVNGAYKAAISYARTGNIAFAQIELEQALTDWQQIQKSYRVNPPRPYLYGEIWTASFRSIEQALTHGITLLDEGNIEGAQQILAPVRLTLHRLRKAHKIELFEDRYITVTKHMDVLWTYRRKEMDWQNKETLAALERSSKGFRYALKAANSIAPETQKNDEIYKRLMGNALTSSEKMIGTVQAQNKNGFINYLRELKSLERMIYLHFG
jgi:hypothetical protein